MQNFPENSPFQSLSISSHGPLCQQGGRYKCPACLKSTKYFCYHCVQGSPHISPKDIPQVTLPIDVCILKDVRELEGKSTSVHAALLAPSQTTLHSVTIADLQDPCRFAHWTEDSVILFPSSQAQSIQSYPDWHKTKRVIVLDGTWSQGKTMQKSPALSSIPTIKLSAEHATAFWRHQPHGLHCLSTIEAIHKLCLEYDHFVNKNKRLDGQFDDLLWYFSFFYHLIQDYYRQRKDQRPFTSRHRPGYIQN